MKNTLVHNDNNSWRTYEIAFSLPITPVSILWDYINIELII